MHVARTGPGRESVKNPEDEITEQSKPRKPVGGEPIHDEEMFVDTLTVLTNSGDEAKNTPSGG
jgi:hypothetical protein